MSSRGNPYQNGQAYHLMNLSIAGYKVFTKQADFERIIQSMRYNQYQKIDDPFSHFLESNYVSQNGFCAGIQKKFYNAHRKVDIIAYCIMSTHFHVVCRQLVDDGIDRFLKQTLSGYTQYFNHRHRRKGPLWIARTKKVSIHSDEHLAVATRYVHLNPTTAYLVEKPEDWSHSSYKEYINAISSKDQFCQKFILEKNWQEYRKSVNERIVYQRELSAIKDLL